MLGLSTASLETSRRQARGLAQVASDIPAPTDAIQRPAALLAPEGAPTVAAACRKLFLKMARKTKKTKQRAAMRRGQPMQPQPSPPEESPAGAASTEIAGERRRVERVTPGTAAVRTPARGLELPQYAALETDDPAIPLERVPYVTSDLRRVALIAAAMVVLIIIADIIVNRVIH